MIGKRIHWLHALPPLQPRPTGQEGDDVPGADGRQIVRLAACQILWPSFPYLRCFKIWGEWHLCQGRLSFETHPRERLMISLVKALLFHHGAHGQHQLCIDYRRLNKTPISDPYQMPCIEDLLNQLSDVVWLLKLDLNEGFYQVPLDKTALHTMGQVVGLHALAIWVEKCTCCIPLLQTFLSTAQII